MASGNFFRGAMVGLPQGLSAGLKAVQLAQDSEETERLTRLATQRVTMQMTGQLVDIGKAPRDLQPLLFDQWTKNYEAATGAKANPDTVQAWKKSMADREDTYTQAMTHLDEYVRGNLDTLDMKLIRGLVEDDPLTAYGKMNTIRDSNEKRRRERQASTAEQTAFAGMPTTGPVATRLADFDRRAAEAIAGGADPRTFIPLRNSLLSEASQEEQRRYHGQQLGMQGAGLAETRRHHGAMEAGGRSLEDRYAMSQGYPSFSQAPQDVQAQILRTTEGRAARIQEAQVRPVPPQQLEEMAMLKNNIELSDQIQSQYKPTYVGPGRGRAGGVGEALGYLGEEEISFRNSVQTLQNDILRASAGLAQTKQERENMLKQVPTANDPPTTFEVKLKQTQQNLRRMYQLRQQQLTGGGYKPPEPLAPAPGARQAPSKVWNYDPATGKLQEGTP